MSRLVFRFLRVGTLLVVFGLLVAACGTPAPATTTTATEASPAATEASPAASTASGQKIQITVSDAPSIDDAKGQEQWKATIAGFAKIRPDVEVIGVPGGYDPKAFAAKVAGGTLEDAFGVWNTEPQKFIKQGIVADVTDYVKQWEHGGEFRPELLQVSSDESGRIYGIPVNTYGIHLVYSRKLFEQAGLDPNNPPKTWEEVRQVAKQIKDKTGVPGFAIQSKDNGGGWQFTIMLYSYGAQLEEQEGEQWQANLNSDTGVTVLQLLKDMRWTDKSMPEEQLLDGGKIDEMLGTGRVAMTFGGPDGPSGLANKYKVDIKDFGVAALPQNGGNATLSGGYTYMFNAKTSPEKLQAAVDWALYRYLSPELYELDLKQRVAAGELVGAPNPTVFTNGPLQEQLDQIRAKYSNVPAEIYAPFVAEASNITLRQEEPIETQKMYAQFTTVLQAILTDQSADPKQQLDTANQQFQAILDQAAQ